MELPNHPPPSRIPAAACLTAWELTGGNLSAVSGGGFRTPYGTFSDTIFFVGTLTEKILRNNQLSSLRVSDPTGVLTLSLSPQNIALIRAAESLDVPGFVAVTAVVKLRAYAGKTYLELLPEILTPADRKTRDAWLCCAATGALARITALPPSPGRKEFADILANALTNVRDEDAVPVSAPETPAAVTDVQLLAVITELSGKKGAPIADVIARAKTLGMTETDCKAALARLMQEGECYTPTTELIKIA
jgi:RPA family protein